MDVKADFVFAKPVIMCVSPEKKIDNVPLVTRPQVSLVVDGAKRAVEVSFQGLQKNALHYTFKGRDLHALFDRQWHKLGVAVQSTIVSLYVDCKLAERRQTEDKADIKRSGRTLVTTRVEDGRPVDVRHTRGCLFVYLEV